MARCNILQRAVRQGQPAKSTRELRGLPLSQPVLETDGASLGEFTAVRRRVAVQHAVNIEKYRFHDSSMTMPLACSTGNDGNSKQIVIAAGSVENLT
jgi:hypothetical protein